MRQIKKQSSKKWCVFFSQSGGEICSIVECLGIAPNLIVTDNTRTETYDERLKGHNSIICKEYRTLSKEEKIQYYRDLITGYDLVTLHGWLNIVPPTICEEFEIYNGHPGLINKYPDLKGKDPQVRAWKNIQNYDTLGSVIHRVTSEVDGGEICTFTEISTGIHKDVESVFKTLRNTSLISWINFLRNIL